MKHPYIPVLTGECAKRFVTKADSIKNCTICKDREEYFRMKYNYDNIMAKSKIHLISNEELNERRIDGYKLILP